ncbi:hypothetical protein EAO69_30405 [Streptomyces sp. me109]|nr:hypothetical protein EAO69_30405 [Streptomyces sp. me109]
MSVSDEVRSQLAVKFGVLFPHLDERQRRLLMGAGCQQDRERAALAVAGEMDFGGQASSRSAEGVIVRFVRWVVPPFRPVAAACWWARTMVESIWTSQSMSPAASACAWICWRARVNTPSSA